MNIRELIYNEFLFFDGATGTYLQENGLKAGEMPEYLNINAPETIVKMHENFLNAGSNVITTNTFGANALKFYDEPYTVEKIVTSAVNNAKKAIANTGKKAYIALDIGPSGKLLKPMGDLGFSDAYKLFSETVIYGKKAGADLIIIETMSDTYELKAAVLAAKENSDLPVFVTVVFDETQKLLTGADVKTVVAMLEGLRVDALGINCGLGPFEMMPIVEEIVKYTSIPVIVNPNAGLPRSENGKTVFDITPEEFAKGMVDISNFGATILGGCCGTTSEHIKAMIDSVSKLTPKPIVKKDFTFVTSYAKAVELGKTPKIVGERINPTGKKKLKEALISDDMDYILKEAIMQQEKNAHILDVNVGLPQINEPEMMERAIFEIQSIIDLPLQIDTSDAKTMEQALRMYNGKAMINSVNGKKEVMEQIFPLVKKYGGVVVGLTLDEDGIPETAQKRFEIAEKIINTAKEYGIDKKDIVIDVLAMTISADNQSAKTTLDALKMVREKLLVNTTLGVSNISFGLPTRDIINSTFFGLALQNGLTAAIINPSSDSMMQAYYSYNALAGLDENCANYIANVTSKTVQVDVKPEFSETTLSKCIEKGLKDTAKDITENLIKTMSPLDIVNLELVPALDKVGRDFANGTLYLPQLLMSAEAAKMAFEVIKENVPQDDTKNNGTIVIATVKGDIHDIGKNIVKVMLENYGFNVIDLGKDVPVEAVVDAVLKDNVKLVGLSALMTTTVVSMEETIKAINKVAPDCKTLVGGAVLTEDYAKSIGANMYAKDAMESVKYAQMVFSIN